MSEQEQATSDPWADAEIISVYSRAQALKDGVLIDVSAIAAEAGFCVPVAVTQGVWAILNPYKYLEAEGQDIHGRTWDLLTVLRYSIPNAVRTDEVWFEPLFVPEPGQPPQPVRCWAKCGPGDDGAPVITILRENED